MKLRLGLIKRFLAGGTTLLVVSVALWVMGGATADAAALSAETPSGPAGSPVLVSGDGFVAGVQVRLCWDDRGCDDLGTAVPQGLVFGSFSTQATIPSSAEPGTYEINGCQLVALGDLTCSDATFEVLAAEPVTTTTAPGTTTTTTRAVTTTTAPPPTTTTLDSSAATPDDPTTTGPQVVDDAPPAEPVDTVEVLPVVSSSEAEPGAKPEAEPGTDSEPAGQSTTTTLSAEDASNTRTYTPPTLSNPDTSEPAEEEQGPTIVLEAASDDASSPLSWLDDPVFFWAAWLAAVMVGGAIASVAAWLIRRRRAT